MDKFVDLLKNLKKNDKVTKNVLFIISDSQKQYKEEISKTILNYYKDCMNKESVREVLFELCSKDEDYLDFFENYSKLFEDGREGLYKLLTNDKKIKKVKIEQKEEKVMQQETPLVINFNSSILDKNYLNQKFDSSVLYASQQCKLCGMRYKEGDELYTIHIDDHFRKNRALEQKSSISREFFSTYESWIRNVEKVILNLKVDSEEKIVYRGSSVYCAICSNKIETMWDDEEDEFILKDCVEIGDENNKKYCHKGCVT